MKVSAAVSFSNAKENTHILGVFQGEDKSAPFCTHKDKIPTLEQLAEADVFQGKKNQTYFFRSVTSHVPNLLFVGLGKSAEVTTETYRCAGAQITKRLESEKIKEAALDLASFHHKAVKKVSSADQARTLAEGLLFAQYAFDDYKTEKQKFSFQDVQFYASDRKHLSSTENSIAQAEATNDALKIARDFSNEPGSHLTPEILANRTQKLAKEYGLSCKVLDKKELKKEKMGALLGVGQGSVNDPYLIVLEYKPKKPKKTIAFVGKAVTFDSGGISLKPGQGMEEMKHDMSGGADVIAATLLAAKLKSPNHIVCVVPSAENMPDGGAIVPSTILTARSGKTIEVQNTDAEGRLILSDALDYAQDYKPDVIIDVATLTGAVVMALSSAAAGIMGNDPALLKKFHAAAEITQERYVELPIFQEYIDDIKSKIADIKKVARSCWNSYAKTISGCT